MGVVVIGRNEGPRLVRCLDAIPEGIDGVVYVDSASTDDSVAHARGRGAEVVELDMSIPFTAARARNAGVSRLRERWPHLRYVQLLDGDCALVPGWIDAARAVAASDDRVAIVCGRRREIHPQTSMYNWLADMEWDTPVGDVASCGGDALARLEHIVAVGGYDERLIAGEEPELCARLRARGWVVRRIGRDMTLHDAGMTRFGQWWRRAMRSGYGFAQVNATERTLYARERRSTVVWAALVPGATVLAAALGGALGLAVPLVYLVLWARVVRHRRARGEGYRAAALYAGACVLGKLPEFAGVLKHEWERLRGREARLIEYK